MPWALVFTLVLIIAKFSFAPTMPWWLVLLPMIVTGVMLVVMFLAFVLLAFVAVKR